MTQIKCSVGRCGYNSAKESKATDGVCQCKNVLIIANVWDGGNSVYCKNYYSGDKPFGKYQDSNF